MTSTQRFMITLFGLALAGAAAAAPVQLTEAQFTARTAGRPTIIDTFSSYPNMATNPFTLQNGHLVQNATTIDGDPVDRRSV